MCKEIQLILAELSLSHCISNYGKKSPL